MNVIQTEFQIVAESRLWIAPGGSQSNRLSQRDSVSYAILPHPSCCAGTRSTSPGNYSYIVTFKPLSTRLMLPSLIAAPPYVSETRSCRKAETSTIREGREMETQLNTVDIW